MMSSKRIVITGMGVIAPNGINKEAFFQAIFAGKSGIKPISLFDVSGFTVRDAGEISDFNAETFLGSKGLRTLDRSTKLICSAAKLALDDGALVITQDNADDTGVVIGSTLGSIASISDFDREAIKEGPRYVNPALFPNTVINSPASQVSIKFSLKGFNTTVSDGYSAGLDAVNYAADFLKQARARFVLAGSVEELCIQIFLGFYKSACLAGSSGKGAGISCPFDSRHNGVVLAEGVALFVLETAESAQARQAKVYAEVLGFGTGYAGAASQRARALSMAMRAALKEAGLKPADIDYVSAGANSAPEVDFVEAEAIRDVFGAEAERVPVSAVKSMLGESFSASASLQLAAAMGAIEQQLIPPTINYQGPDPKCILNLVGNRAEQAKISNVLVNALGKSGNCSSLIVARHNA